MTKSSATKPTAQSAKPEPKTKNQQVIDLLSREGGATLEELSTLANWQPHSTRSFMTGLKKKGHVIESDKIDGIRRYRIVPSGGA
jgi:DNA-binding IclR family transcriptional regulator